MISFVKYRSITAILSCFLVVSFVGLSLYNIKNRGQVFNYSVDFTGGTQVLLKFNKNIDALTVKNALVTDGFNGVSTRNFTDNEVLIRVKDFSNDTQGIASRMQASITSREPGYEISVLQNEAVGAGVGSELRWKSFRAILVVLLALLLYIALRFFSFGFALGAVVALMHDALMMLFILLLFDRDISINVMGAILAVLGYSINDTIVIFSQIRNNMTKMRGMPMTELVDLSLNQTLRRTLLTSITTGLVVISMFILGGDALRDFSLALLVGVIFGTYSSIYIASPIMMLFNPKNA